MKKIMAIGGGEIAFAETTQIDKAIVELSGKKRPKLLFVPTASNDSAAYIQTVEKYFGSKRGCEVNALVLSDKSLSRKKIKEAILSADIIYVGGGNTFKMMRVWRRLGVDVLLKRAYEQGIVLSGLSAGAICWFTYGNSDSRKFRNPQAPLIKVSGLNFIGALLCPHYDEEKDRKTELKKMMKKTPGVALALDNCAAIEVVDDTYRILSSKKSANAYKVYWSKGTFYEQKISQTKNFQPLSELLSKDGAD